MVKKKNAISTPAYPRQYRWMGTVWMHKRINYENMRNIRI